MENGSELHAIRVRENIFTDVDLEAAESLVQLSESMNGADSSAASTSSSPRSVNTCWNPTEMEENEMEMVGPARRRKRYRSISDLYKTTAEINRKRQHREDDEVEEGRKVAVL